MKHRSRFRWLAPLLVLSAACAGGDEAPLPSLSWSGATVLSAEEEYPFGVVVHGDDVLYTTGLTQVGDHAVRIAPLAASPAASRILVADPGGKVPNGALALDGDDLYVAAGSGIVRVSLATGSAAVVVDQRPTTVNSLAVDDRFVWWTTSTYKFPAAAEVARMPKGGGPIEILAVGVDDKGNVYQDDPVRKAVAVPDTSDFHSLLLDGDGVLVATPGAILRVAPGRSTETIVGEGALGGAPGSIVADAHRIYAVVAGPRDNLVGLPRAGGGPLTKLARDADNSKGIALTGDELVFFTHGGGSGGRSSLNAVPTTGGAARVVTSGRYANGDLAVTGDRLVFSADSRVWSAPLR